MRARHVVLAAAVWLGLTVAAVGQPAEYVIDFNRVVVRGLPIILESPTLAHMAVPDEPVRPTVPTTTEPPPDGAAPPPAASSLGDSPLAGPPAAVAVPSPDPSPAPARPSQPMAFAPGQTPTANPNFVEHGFLVETFWAARTGTRDAYFKRGHFHPPDLASGFEAQHLGNPKELHGLYIRSLDGMPFGIKSLRYRVTRNRELPYKPFSIEGFNNYSVNVLLSRTFDPRLPVRPQFVAFPVGLAAGNDLSLPWWPLPVTGFELVDQLYLTSSASVDIDDIVLTRFGSVGAGPRGRVSE